MFDLLQSLFSQPLVNVLLVLYAGLHDLGLAILALTALIRLVLAPLSFKQARLQQKKQALAPQIAQLEQRYEGDQQGFLQAQQALFKEHQLSLFGGCLPQLLQLPILYGLFFALQEGLHGTVAQINRQLYPFLHFAAITPPSGLHPLDPVLRWFSWLPWQPVLNLSLADPTHVLPVLAALFTLLQLRLFQQKPPPLAALSSRKERARAPQGTPTPMGLLTFIGPLVTLWIGWHAAAGLALYWAASTLWQIGLYALISGWSGRKKGGRLPAPWIQEQAAQRIARPPTTDEAHRALRLPAPGKRSTRERREQVPSRAAKPSQETDQVFIPSSLPASSTPQGTGTPPKTTHPRLRPQKQGKRMSTSSKRTTRGKARPSHPQQRGMRG